MQQVKNCIFMCQFAPIRYRKSQYEKAERGSSRAQLFNIYSYRNILPAVFRTDYLLNSPLMLDISFCPMVTVLLIGFSREPTASFVP